MKEMNNEDFSGIIIEKSKLEKVMNKLKKTMTDDELAELLKDRLSDILESQKLGLL